MSIADLQSWLVEQGIEKELDQLTRHAVRGEIANLSLEPDAVAAPIDWQRLILAASVLARSDTRLHHEAALRIATSAVTMSKSIAVIDAGAVLLRKLSNFRAVALAGKRSLLVDNLDGRLGMSLRIEAQRRQMDQAILVESSGRWLQVNDFQQRFWEMAAVNGWISASAPTASGKTFLVLQWLIDQMHGGSMRVAVYLAPTRALVAEIETNLELLLRKPGSIEISSLPLTEKYDSAQAGGAPLILVFTQERLHLLVNLVGDDIAIDVLIVDEAHKIGDSQRGVILQDAIERVSRANSELKLVFISPATQNPGELLADAPYGTETAPVDSDVPTVLQNLIVAEQVARKPKLWKLSIVKTDTKQSIGTLTLASSPTGPIKKLAFIAAAAGEQGGTLVYANRASDAEEIANLISQLIPTTHTVDHELLELADLTRKGVHPQYRLAALVERGVAFHYGNMPSLIRLEIERLFRAAKIRFLVCTSTLVEGVNLSCRTIVLRGPRKGVGKPIEPHDFWNLAGRAGRWGDEFQGNIICIDPGNAQAWPHGVPARARYPIKRESDAVIETGNGLADYLDRRATAELSELEEAEQYEQVGSYLLTTFLRLGSIAQAALAKRHDKDLIKRLDESLGVIAAQIEIDADVANRHPGISALGLQRLLDAFRRYEGDPENLLPAPVDSEDSYDRFVTIMRRIDHNMFPAFVPEGLIPLYARIVVQWLKGFSLAMMIRRNIEYHAKNNRHYKLPTLIRQTMEHVEQIARFKAPKYFSAYMDVLHIHFRAIGRDELVEDGLDIGTQLEFGVSSRTLLSLMQPVAHERGHPLRENREGQSRSGRVSRLGRRARQSVREHGHPNHHSPRDLGTIALRRQRPECANLLLIQKGNRMPSKPIMIGAFEFSKRGDAYAFLKEILAGYDVGDKVNDADSNTLRYALALHPDSADKIGSGIQSFSVRSADFGTKCFWVNRIDGSTEKFALRACVYGEK